MRFQVRQWRVGKTGVWADALDRVQSHGLEVLTKDPAPNFPHGFSPTVRFDFGGLGDKPHICEEERVIEIHGGVLVFDVLVKAIGGCKFQACERFAPYYSGPMKAIHPGIPVDEREWRPACSVEALCALALHPWAKSFQFATAHNGGGLAQAYKYCGAARVSEYYEFRGHHLLYVRRDVVPHPINMRRL